MAILLAAIVGAAALVGGLVIGLLSVVGAFLGVLLLAVSSVILMVIPAL
jgi:hypothetical protein